MTSFYTAIRQEHGEIRRARGFYLYTSKNIRLIDMYLDGGASFFGRRTGQMHLACKQYLDKGLVGAFPTAADIQLSRALFEIFPKFSEARWYCNEYRIKKLFKNTPPIWFFGLPQPDGKNPIIIRPPFFANCIIVLANQNLPPSDAIFPPILFSITKALFYAKKQMQHTPDFWSTPNFNAIQNTAKTKKQHALFQEKQILKEILIPFWNIKGRLLYPVIPRKKYHDFFLCALHEKILISPNYEQPSILPLLNSYRETILRIKSIHNSFMKNSI